ncbi:MAG: cytochrome C [Candidatus Neomarinimicrobiota bacterium]|nr:MAG: cytochrome C [Candidatus Neomarinimicrobiota bacterium]
MAQLFPKWTNRLPLLIVAGLLIVAVGLMGLIWYYGSPWYTDVGYRPEQPVPYSHKLHAGDLGIDCRYCHVAVEKSAVASVPPTQTCMNCHRLIKPDSEKLRPIRESWETGTRMQWIRVHKIPDYAYFNHSAHLRGGIGCETCHGNIAQMEVVQQVQPLSMSWCVSCHRNPAPYLRPFDQLTTMGWTPPDNQNEVGQRYMQERNIHPPTDCAGCHR